MLTIAAVLCQASHKQCHRVDLCRTNVNVRSFLVCFCPAQHSVCAQPEQCQIMLLSRTTYMCAQREYCQMRVSPSRVSQSRFSLTLSASSAVLCQSSHKQCHRVDLCRTNVNVRSFLACFGPAQRSVCAQREQCQMRVSERCQHSITLSVEARRCQRALSV